VVVLLLCWCVFVAFQLLQSHWGHCTAPYWAIYSVQAALCLVAEVIFIWLVRPLGAILSHASIKRMAVCRAQKHPEAREEHVSWGSCGLSLERGWRAM
jgi:type VI protein secretion system component VasK